MTSTDKPVALEFPIELEIWKCWFLRMKENWRTRRKTLGARARTTNKLKPHMTPGPGIKLWTHWGEALSPLCHPSYPPPLQKTIRKWIFWLLCYLISRMIFKSLQTASHPRRLIIPLLPKSSSICEFAMNFCHEDCFVKICSLKA